MAYEAKYRFARISARKVRPLADLIRGKLADEALNILRYQPHRGARMLEKVLHSALANAEEKPQSESATTPDAMLATRRVPSVTIFILAITTHRFYMARPEGRPCYTNCSHRGSW